MVAIPGPPLDKPLSLHQPNIDSDKTVMKAVMNMIMILKAVVIFCFALPFRASDDPEKTNTTYAEDSQPTQGQNVFLCFFLFISSNILVNPDRPYFSFCHSFTIQKSPFVWTNQMLSLHPAVRMESRDDSSPPGRPAAASPSMNRHITNRRLRTKGAGSSLLSHASDSNHDLVLFSLEVGN